MNKNLGLPCIYAIRFELENQFSTYHIFNYFALRTMFSYKETTNITEAFHFKTPRLGRDANPL